MELSESAQAMVDELQTEARGDLPERPTCLLDGQNPFCTTVQKPWNGDSPLNKKQWFPMVSQWCRISSIHSIKR